MKIIFALFFLLNLGWSIFVSAFPPPDESTSPCVILRDSYDREISDKNPSGLSDSVFGSFSHLEADKQYQLSIMRGCTEISNLCLSSDKKGVITTCALWWNLGFNYNINDGTTGIDNDFENHTYCLRLKDDSNNLVIEKPIPVAKGAFIYTCDEKGNPKNVFIRNKDDVYLIAKNSTWQDTNAYIYVVKDHWSWIPGDKLDDKDFLMQKHVAALIGGKLKSPHMIWQKDDLEVGSYDIIVSRSNLGILVNKDLIDSNYGVGFKIIEEQSKEPQRKKEDIIQELVCQAPPHSLCRGNLEQPHRAIYKDYFSPQEEIWVAVETHNPTCEQRKAQKVRIYIIEHCACSPLKDKEELQDVSGGWEEVLLQPDCAHAVFTRVWCNPKIREEGYDVVIDFKNSRGRFGTYDKGLDILDNGMKMGCERMVKGKHLVKCKKVEHGGFYVPEKWVCLDSVSFNHTGNSIGDNAITIRMNLDTDVRVPEWQRGKKTFPAAYVKNNRVTVRPGFIASIGITNATLKAYAVSGNLDDIIEMKTFINLDKCSNTYRSDTRYFQVIKNTPGKIQSFYQEWEWYLLGINNGPNNEEIHIGTSINRIYIVLGVPQFPWTIEKKTAPWTDILDLAGQVASGENTPEAAAQKITQFLYGEVGAKYEKKAHYSEEDDAFSAFQLTQFLSNIPTVGGVNCYDMGKALVTFANVLGCNLTLRYCDTFGDLNCIKPTGYEWDCNMKFNNHAFASIGDNVFDASLKVNSWGNPDQKPYRAAWMIDIPWCGYKEMVVKPRKAQPPYPQVAIFKIKE